MSIATILVVEDNPITRRVVRLALLAEGYEVLEADSAHAALNHTGLSSADLVLQDIQLPDMNGVELLGHLRRASRSEALPVLAFTGLTDDRALLAAGFTDVIVKPVEPTRLVEAVRIHLGRTSAERLGQRRRILVIDDQPAQLRLQAAFLKQHGFEVRTAPDGAAAIDEMTRERPDVVLCDVLMPGLNGFELCRAVRRDPRFATVPVVLASSQELTASDRTLAASSGAASVARRSPDLLGVLEAIVMALGGDPSLIPDPRLPRRGLDVDHLAQQAALRAGIDRGRRVWRAVEGVLSELEGIAERSAGNADVLGDVLASFLDASGFSLGAAFMLEPSGSLVARATLGLAEGIAPRLLARSSVLQDALRSGAPSSLQAGDVDPEARELLREAGIRSMALVPLRNGGEPLGLLLLGSVNAALPADWLDLAHVLDGPVAQVLALSRSVARLAASEHRFRSIADASGDGIVVTDDAGKIVYANPATEGIFGTPAPALVGTLVESLVPFLGSAGASLHGILPKVDGPGVPVEVTLRSFEDPPGRLQHVVTIRDLRERMRLEETLWLASHDTLTSLQNRWRFQEELDARLAETKRYGTAGALLLLDLDHFKIINDTHGHGIGDAVLVAVAETLKNTLRTSDTAARLGGDELAVILPHAGPDQALTCARKILERIAAIELEVDGGVCVSVGASIGIATFPASGVEREALVRAADDALYTAKRQGRGTAQVHTPA